MGSRPDSSPLSVRVWLRETILTYHLNNLGHGPWLVYRNGRDQVGLLVVGRNSETSGSGSMCRSIAGRPTGGREGKREGGRRVYMG